MQSVKDARVKEKPIRVGKVAEITGYSPGYIYKLAQWGKIPCHKPRGGRGRSLFYESDILEFLSQNRQAADYEVSRQADAILNGEAR